MKKMIVVGILGMVLVSLASAGLVGFLSDSASVEVTVEGPEFYTAPSNELWMNERPTGSSTDNLFYGRGNNNNREYIMTDGDALGGIDFYDPELEFVIDIEVSNLTIPRGVDLEFGFIATNGNSRPICSTQFLNIGENDTYTIPCDTIITSPENVDKFYFSIRGMANEDIKYILKTKDSYVKIIGVLP